MTNEDDHLLIIEALQCFHSKCVTETIRKRAFGKRKFTKDQLQSYTDISTRWKDKAKRVSQLLLKLDNGTS